jgi:hypothetical protein
MGSFKVYATGEPPDVVEVPCDCVDQMILSRWLAVRGIPMPMQRLRWAHMLSIPDAVYPYLASFPQHKAMGSGLVFEGASGSGKTGLASLMVKRILEAGIADCFVVHGSSFMERVNGWNDTEKRERFMHRIATVPVLLYDSLGHEVAAGISDKPRPDEVKSSFAIERLLRQRTDSGLVTLVTTNLERISLGRMFGQNTLGMLEQTCMWVPVRSENNAHERAVGRAQQEFLDGVSRPVVLS